MIRSRFFFFALWPSPLRGNGLIMFLDGPSSRAVYIALTWPFTVLENCGRPRSVLGVATSFSKNARIRMGVVGILIVISDLPRPQWASRVAWRSPLAGRH